MPGKHTLELFDHDLQQLREEVLRLSGLAGEELDAAMLALLHRDAAQAQRVIDSDLNADHLQGRIHHHMTVVLARQQAMADDLREILAAGRMADYLERLGDQAKKIARRSTKLAADVEPRIADRLVWMNERVRATLHQVMDAYARRDAEEANVAWSSDVELDTVYGELFGLLLERMRQDSATIADGVQLLLIAKGLERAGDYLTNIAEEIYLMVTGEPLQGPRPKVDTTAPSGS
jgi:phosphate transport system protein